MNVAITGLNQLSDVDIDRVNKPYLPLVSGELSLPAGRFIVASCLCTSLALGFRSPSPYLRTLLMGSAVLGAAYSVPPMRLKRNALAAAACILIVRGALINGCMYAYFQSLALNNPISMVPYAAMISYFTVFGTVIALMKDVPDAAGDKMHGIKSLSVQAGPTQALSVAATILRVLLFTTGTGLVATSGTRMGPIFVGIMAWCMEHHFTKHVETTNAEDKAQVHSLYMHLWNLFYASYFLLPWTTM
jgi:homogentisate phytyltransferase/homogentisate geranylgeranyltransferase